MLFDDSEKTDEELVIMVLEQGQGYFFNLMRRYESKLLRYIRRLTSVSDDDAQDILQEVFIKVYQNLNDFNLKQKFSSWIYRIAHNEVINNFRKSKSRGKDLVFKIDDELFQNISSKLNLDEEIDGKIKREVILNKINNLDEKYKEILVLKYFEDKDYKELSFILKKPIGSVGTLINRAKKQLADEIEKGINL